MKRPIPAFFLVSTLFLIAGSALAEAPKSTLRITSEPGANAKAPAHWKIRAEPADAHHINEKAPAYLEINGEKLKPTVIERQGATFQTTGEKGAPFILSLFVCDDPNTFCEKQILDGKLEVQNQVPPPPSKKTISQDPTRKTSSVKPDAHSEGFIVNDSAKALSQAKAENKPLLIDFFGIWCPPCNEMDQKIFSSTEFKFAAKGFVLLKLDADKPESWELKAKYKIGGYPTIVFAAPNGDEIERIVGVPTKDAFLKQMTVALKNPKNSFEPLLALANQGDRAASDQVGVIYLERGETTPALKYLTGTTTKKLELTRAQLKEADAKSAEEKIPLYEKATAEFKSAPESTEWLMELADLYKDSDKKKRTWKEAVVRVEKIVAKPKELQKTMYAAGDLLILAAEAEEKLGNPAGAKTLYLKAADRFKKDTPIEWERGMTLNRAYSLWKGGKVADAEKIYLEMEKRYPEEFTYYYAHGSMLHKLKRSKEARPYAALAYQYSYGDNRLRAAKVLADVLIALDEKADALTTIQQTLKSTEIPKDPTIRTHRYVKTLKDLEQELNQKEKKASPTQSS
jgi:thiol-disulfide isomerase/thioredoxin